jgi:hypothetical protein
MDDAFQGSDRWAEEAQHAYGSISCLGIRWFAAERHESFCQDWQLKLI